MHENERRQLKNKKKKTTKKKNSPFPCIVAIGRFLILSIKNHMESKWGA